jgi:hypothetical protein
MKINEFEFDHKLWVLTELGLKNEKEFLIDKRRVVEEEYFSPKIVVKI